MLRKTIDDIVEEQIRTKGDISEHLLTLKRYASECEHVTEFGVRWVCSTWALLAGKPKTLRSYDVVGIPEFKKEQLNYFADNLAVDFKFDIQNVLTLDIEPTDMLFIDTLHSYAQLRTEFHLHADKVNKFIVLHDVITFGKHDEGQVDQTNLPVRVRDYIQKLPPKQGLMPAVADFLEETKYDWTIGGLWENNNGLMVLKKN